MSVSRFSRAFFSIAKRTNSQQSSKLLSSGGRTAGQWIKGKGSILLFGLRVAGAAGVATAVCCQNETQAAFVVDQSLQTPREERRHMMRAYCNGLMSEGRLSELFVNASELERMFGMKEAVGYYRHAAEKGEPKSMITIALLDTRDQQFWAYEAVKKGELIGQMLIPTLCDQKEVHHHQKDLKRLNSRQYLDTPNKLMKVYTLVTLSTQENLSLSAKHTIIKEATEVMKAVDAVGDRGLTLFEAKLTMPLYQKYRTLLRMKNPEMISACAPKLKDIRGGARTTFQEA